jgi:hypothetical protein
MNRPLALIQGRLAQPNARLLAGLPPPYGTYRDPARPATQRRPQPAFQDAARRASPEAPHTWFAPGRKFRLFYKSPSPRDSSSRLDAELAEARSYLEMDKGRRKPSSRLDHVLGAAIFVACSVVLGWLLTSSPTPDAGKSATATIGLPAVMRPGTPVAVRAGASDKSTQPAAELMQGAAKVASSPSEIAPEVRLRSEPRRSPQAELRTTPIRSAQHSEPHLTGRASIYDTAGSHVAKMKADVNATLIASGQLPTTHSGEALANERPSQSNSTRPTAATTTATTATPLAVSMQPERTARSLADEAPVQAALRDWGTQQRRSPVPAQANASTANADTTAPHNSDWNTHLSQRRITDNPTAFQASSDPN